MTLPVACLFDMDELLLASVPQWRAAVEHLLKLIDGQWTPELAALCQGLNARDVARVVHRELQPDLTVDECVRIMREELLQRFAHDELVPMPGAVECVQRLSAEYPLAVASGSPLPCIQTAMEALNIAHCFQTMLSSESVPRGKPHPDVFLAAASALGAQPTRCVVFEDSLAGVKAGRAAGMKVVAVPSGPNKEEIALLADRVLPSLREVTLDTLRLFPGDRS